VCGGADSAVAAGTTHQRRAPQPVTNRKMSDPVSDDVFERFKVCAVEVLAVDADKVTKDASFADDLDADSLDLVELVMRLEEEFDISVDESELEGVETVQQALDLVSGKI
jgi:acyl carrier protein